jgi:hypothetical protein
VTLSCDRCGLRPTIQDCEPYYFRLQTCKAFNGFIGENKLVWLRSLRIASIEQATAPHSFDPLTTACQFKKAATRHYRLCSTLLSPTIPASLRVVKYSLGHADVLPDGLFSYLTPVLLPGGRWLLSYAFNGSDSYVLCWDTFMNHECDDDEILGIRPVAHCALPLSVVDQLRGDWAQIQYEPDAERVNIAIRLTTESGR